MCHETIIVPINYLLFNGRPRCTSFFKRNYKWFMPSVMFPGHSITYMLFSVNRCFNICAVWHVNTWDFRGLISLMKGRSFVCRMMSIYFLLFSVSSVAWRWTTASADIHTQNILLLSLECYLCAVWMQSVPSPMQRLTYFLSSVPNIDILVSSVYITCFSHWIHFSVFIFSTTAFFGESYLSAYPPCAFSVPPLHRQKHQLHSVHC